MSKMGIIKVWFGWSLWLIAIALGLILWIALFELSGSTQIDLGVAFIMSPLSGFEGFYDWWSSFPDIRVRSIFCLTPIMILVLILVWADRPRFWLKCPNCHARGWILNQEQYGKSYKTGGFFSGRRRIRKRWNLCVRCNHEYGHKEEEIAVTETIG